MAEHEQHLFTADEAFTRLLEGHRRFLSGRARFSTLDRDHLTTLAAGQQPFATILGCSDSRVPPEIIFDATLGEIFVIRVAGNTMAPEIAGSLQYAVSHLHTPLIVVLGHEGCGAIQAALKTRQEGHQHFSRIQMLVDRLLPALEELDASVDPDSLLSLAVEANVRYVADIIRHSPEGQLRLKEGRVRLLGAIYQLDTGAIRLLD
ncbi:MAG: carbonic anhydrase [Acidobacteria bacterium]|nr:carbonic anhydrase [Acidobacteriota bacterium]